MNLFLWISFIDMGLELTVINCSLIITYNRLLNYKVQTFRSKSVPCDVGLLQTSILYPLLFILYDLNLSIKVAYMYADDTNI